MVVYTCNSSSSGKLKNRKIAVQDGLGKKGDPIFKIIREKGQ
jgi:hypothetical protein